MASILNSHYLQEILNAITDGIYISDRYGKTLWVNDASERMLGKSREELMGRSVTSLEEEGIFTPSVTMMAIEQEKMVSTVQSLPDQRSFLVTGHVIKDEEGNIELIVVHSRDITEAFLANSQLEQIEALVNRYSQELRTMRVHREYEHAELPLIGRSKVHQKLMELINRVAGVHTTVLIHGETGVGKNVISQYIHKVSARHNGPFVNINCSTIPESLIESELFGYKKGAFTGARSQGKVGLVEMANQGTLFLDEISELPLHLQSKLLQLLQEKTYLPIGATISEHADVRIIAATNRDLMEMVQKGEFRSDLYYRLNILPVHISSLRERKEDIFALLYYYLQKFNKAYQLNRSFSGEVMEMLQTHDWPGNIRELENLVERLVITARQDEISFYDLPETVFSSQKVNPIQLNEGQSLTTMLEGIEKETIMRALDIHQSTRKASQALGITQSLLMRRLKKYGREE